MATSTSTGWPDATNTGVPAGVTLTSSGDVIIDKPGTVISGLNIRGSVYINADNVTVENCQITSGGWAVVKVKSGVTGAVVQDNTIDGTGSGPDGTGNEGIMGQGTFLRNNISNVENGITITGNNSVIEGNYIHDLNAGGSPHYDGIQIDGGVSNIEISHNTIINDRGWTSAIMIDNYFGATSNVSVDNNLLVGGAYTVYSDGSFSSSPITGVSFTNNHIGGAAYGPALIRGSNPVYTGNTDDGATLAQGLSTTGQPTAPSTPLPLDAPKIASFSNDSGVAGDGITNDSTLTLTGTAAANSTVKVFDGTTQIGTATAGSSGAWNYTTAALADGGHNLTAKATNASGTSSASAAVAVKIDTTAPTAPTMASSSPTTTLSSASTSLVSTAAAGTTASTNVVALTGTAEANSTVKVFDGTAQIGTATTNSSGSWSFKTGTLATGNHSFTSKAMDAAGNTGAASTALAVNIPSTTPGTPSAPGAPKIASFSNDTGVTGDGITSDNTLTMKGAAAANSTVKVFDGTTQIGTATVDSSGAWNYTTAALADGNHSLTAKATDASGNTGAASSALAVKIDTAAPTAPKIVSFSPDGEVVGDGITNADHVTLTGTAEANSTVKVFDGTTQIGTATANDSGAWNYATANLADGSHSFTSKAMDAAGNTSAASAALGVKVDAYDAQGAGSTFTNFFQKWNDTVTFKGTADPYSQVTIYDNGQAGSVGTAKTGSDGMWSLTTKSAVSDTVHNFTTKVMDSSGNVSSGTGSAILGTNGADTLKGTSGNDLFKGNGGNDTFVFEPNFGKDIVGNFQAAGRGHDVVQMSKSVFDSFADVLAHASQIGRDVTIDAGGGNTLTLKDTKLAALDKTDFHFA